jgi:hypothetical protein
MSKKVKYILLGLFGFIIISNLISFIIGDRDSSKEIIEIEEKIDEIDIDDDNLDTPVGVYKFDTKDFNGFKEGVSKLEINDDKTWTYTWTNTSVYPRETKTETGSWDLKTIEGLIYRWDGNEQPEEQSVSLIKFQGDQDGILQYFVNYDTGKMMLYQWEPESSYLNFNDVEWSRGKDIFLIGLFNMDDVLRQ